MNKRVADLLDQYLEELHTKTSVENDWEYLALHLGVFVSKVKVCIDILRTEEDDPRPREENP